MKKKIGIIISITVAVVAITLGLLYFLQTRPIAYDSFPPQLKDILDKKMTELQSKGGTCIAGKVSFGDRKPITSGKDVMANLCHGIDEPLWIYKGGWFIMDVISSSYVGPDKNFILRAFGYDPINIPITLSKGEITYLKFKLKKTPPEKLASVRGVVTDNYDYPVEGAHISISFPFASHGINNEPYRTIQTDSSGEYSFYGLSVAKHNVVASKSGYSYHSVNFTPTESDVVIENLKLYPKRKIKINYIYQPDGSRDFTSLDIKTGTIDWLEGEGGVDFSKGEVTGYDYKNPRDLELRQRNGELEFRIFYANGKNNGFYDAGTVPFDSVAEAAETGYEMRNKQCEIGHVYVVRTYENHYAKFIVKSIK